ncbi:MAG: four helix bundle protein [Ignavibacteriae bacterium]|jgi:four helix bundle protein|nr:four helix bundle protein [Ignavibacteriota bacterium]NOG98095.1 four helix bundle protein [Ignavibacteriota bacterium]
MIKAKVFTDLIVWQKAHKFVLQVYKSTKEYPKEEIYGLTSRFRRAAVSIPANISEGFKKRSKLDKARYLNIAEGSLEECRYYIILSNDLGYYKKDDLNKLLEEASKLLSAYRNKIVNS